MLLNCGVGEDSWESLGLQRDPTSPSLRKSVLNICRMDWCWGWSSSTLATSCEELTHWKRPWCLEGLGAGGERDDREWDGWMASPSRWMWVCVNSGSWWWIRRPGVLLFMGLKSRTGQRDLSELNWCWLVGTVFLPVGCLAWGIRTVTCRLLAGPSFGKKMVASQRAHTNDYFLELLLPVSVPTVKQSNLLFLQMTFQTSK